MPSPIARLNPPTLPDAGRLGYSQISVVGPGRLAFVSGQVASDRAGSPVPEGLAAQARIVAGNVRAALDALGASPADVVMARIYAVGLTPAWMEEAMPHLMAAFDGAGPSITGIGVAALASPEFKVEMEVTVRLPD